MTKELTYNSFELFWNLYDKKTSKEKAEKKWYSLSAKDQGLIMLHIPKYKLKQPDRQFRKDPCTYLNNKSWLDEVYGKKEEEKQIYRETKPKRVSQEPSKSFDHDNHRHMRETLKRNFDHGIFIKDHGDLYTTILGDKIKVPIEVRKDIADKEEKEEGRERNRFEPKYSGSIKTNVRDKCLNWWLSKCREEKREIWKEI